MKYKTLSDLAEAFEWGELSKDYCWLTLDNDRTFAYEFNPDNEDGCKKVFNGGDPNKLLREALTDHWGL